MTSQPGNDPNSGDQKDPEKRHPYRFYWLTGGLTAIIVAVISLLVSHSSSSNNQPPGSTAASSRPDTTASGSNSPPLPVRATVSASGSAVADGTQLGAYQFNLPGGYYVPLGPTAPKQSQFTIYTSDDLGWDDSAFLITTGGDKLLSLPTGSTPTYQACANATSFIESASDNPGTAVCVVESTGRIAGVTVVSAVPNQYLVIKVVIWQNSPS